ncbi:response regulator [Paenibacillus sp. y28]|uniref:response regulator n=1 Tax=Paenibacillus sp. y28 TaxID=3129110 RepID=UPI003019C8AB
MYKLLLIDDEADVRDGVALEVDWAECGFEMAGTAENGREALELIERIQPDVVVTDIQMPFMDGLQLSEWIRERYPTIKIIVLTGFDEFEYAQKAVKLQIDEYLLKPFSSQEFVEVLLKARSRIEEETEQKRNMEMLQEHYRQSLPVLREVFLASLVTRKQSAAEIAAKARNYNVDLAGKGYLVSVISMDYPGGAAQPEEAGLVSEGSLRYAKDTELKLFALVNIAEEIARRYGAGLVYLHNDAVIVLTISPHPARHDVMKPALAALEEIRQSVERYLKFTVTIGVGTVGDGPEEIKDGYRDAVLALDYRLILGGNRIICIDDVEKRSVEKLRFDELQEQALIRCMKVGTLQELKALTGELFGGITAAAVSVQDCQLFLMEIVTAVLKAAKDADLDLEQLLGPGHNPYADIGKYTDLEEAKERLTRLCIRVMDRIAADRQHSHSSLVEKAKEYTRAHFHESEISITRVCGHLHISAGYFSSIFKKETKLTFVQYLMQVRMEAAKSLLRTTDLKAFEISERVGFSEPNYFSFCFRKHTGMTPKDYRSGARDPETES